LDHDVILDGEMCVLDVNGVSQFNEGIAFRTHCTTDMAILNASLKYPITYVVFDILELDGKDLRSMPWHERRKLLDSLNIKYKNMQVIPYSDDIIAKWKEVEDKGGEGIILKKKDAVYMENYRSSSWRKVKNIKEVDLTFIKYTVNPKGIRVETEDGHACQVSGFHAPPVKTAIDLTGKCLATIRHLGWTGRRYRQPVFAKIVE